MNFLVVFLGGGFGAIVRYLLSLIMPKSICAVPYCTLLANFLGCFFATLVFSYFVVKTDFNPLYKTFLITGFCGGLSTLSTLSLEVLEYMQSGDYARGIAYIVLSIVICLCSVILALVFVKKYL